MNIKNVMPIMIKCLKGIKILNGVNTNELKCPLHIEENPHSRH